MGRPKETAREITPTAQRIIDHRQRRGLSQTDMAKFLDVDLSSYARVELGAYRPSVELIQAIIDKYTDVTAKDFIVRATPLTKAQAKAEAELEALVHDIRTLTPQQRSDLAIQVEFLKLNRPYKVILLPKVRDE